MSSLGICSTQPALNVKRRPSLLIAVVVFFTATPFASLLLWHVVNARLPQDDAANYLQTAAEIYTMSEGQGVWSTLGNAYRHRGWRPIFYPVSAVPFLFLFGGNPHWAVGATQVLWFSILYLYSFLFFRAESDLLPSVIGVAFLSTLPWVGDYSRGSFFSELSMVAASVASAYHYYRSGHWSTWAHSLASGLWLGVALTLQPIVVSGAFVLPLAYLVCAAVRESRAGIKDIVLALAFIGLVVTLHFVRFQSVLFSTRTALVLLFCVITADVVLLIIGRRKLNAAFGLFFLAAISVSALWWLPFIRELFDWALTAMPAGPMGKRYPTLAQLDLWKTCVALWRTMGSYQMLTLVGLTGISLASAFYYQTVKFAGLGLMLTGLAGLAIVAVGTWATGDLAPRRAFIAAYAVEAGLVMIVLSPGIPWARFRLAVIAALTVLQLIAVVQIVFLDARNHENYALARIAPYTPPTRGGDYNTEVLRRVNSAYPGRQIATFTLSVSDPGNRVFDPYTLNALAVLDRSPTRFGYPWEFDKVADGYALLRKQGYGVIMLDLDYQNPETYQNTPTERLTTDLIRRANNHTLRQIGWIPVSTTNIGNRRILFLEKDDGLQGRNNLAWFRNGGVAGATSMEKNFPIKNLNDGDAETAWGALSNSDDVYVYITLSEPVVRPDLKLILFSPAGRQHLRELRVIARDVAGEPWKMLRSRVAGAKAYRAKITVPPGDDESAVTIELDPKDADGHPYRTYGIACLRRSEGDIPNYLGTKGSGVYLRELLITPSGNSGDGDSQERLGER